MPTTVTPYFPPNLDPIKRQTAYGRRGLPKLIEDLAQEETSDSALLSLADALANPENVHLTIEHGGTEQIVKLITNNQNDITKRQHSLLCMLRLSSHERGIQDLLKAQAITVLAIMITNEDQVSRIFAYQTLQNLARNHQAAELIHGIGLTKTIVSILPTDKIEVIEVALAVLCGIIRYMPNEVFATGALPVLVQLLKPTQGTMVKANSADAVMGLCLIHGAKQAALTGGAVSALLLLLDDRKSQVRAAATGALMTISVDVEAKKHLVRENAMEKLMILLNDHSQSVQLNVIKVITNLAEDHRGRFILQGCLPQLEAFVIQKDQNLAEPSQKAIDVITWRP